MRNYIQEDESSQTELVKLPKGAKQKLTHDKKIAPFIGKDFNSNQS